MLKNKILGWKIPQQTPTNIADRAQSRMYFLELLH